jgi:hypothetical protein
METLQSQPIRTETYRRQQRPAKICLLRRLPAITHQLRQRLRRQTRHHLTQTHQNQRYQVQLLLEMSQASPQRPPRTLTQQPPRTLHPAKSLFLPRRVILKCQSNLSPRYLSQLVVIILLRKATLSHQRGLILSRQMSIHLLRKEILSRQWALILPQRMSILPLRQATLSRPRALIPRHLDQPMAIHLLSPLQPPATNPNCPSPSFPYPYQQEQALVAIQLPLSTPVQ